jgi:hypothetical protein
LRITETAVMKRSRFGESYEKVYSNTQLSAAKNKEYENVKNELDKIYSVWTEKSEELENIESEFN